MASSFSVNGKVYLPSSTLAASFGYTSDYLGKLAREEKVLGALVGRQWFIEPESLKVFLHKTKIEKEIRQEELRLERKRTHTALVQKPAVAKSQPKQGLVSLDVLAQTFVIVFCGFFLGGLGVIAVSGNVGTADMLSGAQKSLGDIVASIDPTHQVITKNITPDVSVAASTEGVQKNRSIGEQRQEVFAILPTFPPRSVSLVSTSTSTSSPEVVDEMVAFSDEVRVVVDEEGNRFIEPVFKNKVESPDRFLVVPVMPSEN